MINKIDRLILELKLPPQDAYYKLTHTIEEVNGIISMHGSAGGEAPQRLSPEKNNVVFASAEHGWSFSLLSFSTLYANRHRGSGIDPSSMAKRLWGEWYFDEENKAFSREKSHPACLRTFVQFILEPVYKIYSQVIGENPEELVVTLKRLGVPLKHREVHMDPKPLLRVVLSRFFGYPRGFVDMVVAHVPSPRQAAESKISLNYTGYNSSPAAVAMRKCDSGGPLVINIVKLFNTPDGSKFMSLGRIYSGTVRVGQQVKVLGEAYTQEDEEDMALVEVGALYVGAGRFSVEVNSAKAGNWVLMEGVDGPIKKTATITDATTEDVAIFRPLKFDSASVMKLAVEPLKPAELPKMVEGLRRINKSYPSVTTKVEESGEHVIFGSGEWCASRHCILSTDGVYLVSYIFMNVINPWFDEFLSCRRAVFGLRHARSQTSLLRYRGESCGPCGCFLRNSGRDLVD